MSAFKDFEQSAWENKAKRYQSTWGLVTLQAIPVILDLAKVKPGQSLLDCGCGPGELVKAASERGAKATGCDYSEAMVKIAQSNFPDLHFTREDVEDLSFSDNLFDVVTLNYLLLHVEDQSMALMQAARVLKPNGTLVFSMWLAPQHSVGLKLMFDAVKAHANTSVIPPAQDIFMFADPESSKMFLEKNGFEEFNYCTFNTFWQVASPRSFFDAVQAGTRIGGMIDLQKPKIKELIYHSIAEGMHSFAVPGKGYVIPTPSLIVSARKV